MRNMLLAVLLLGTGLGIGYYLGRHSTAQEKTSRKDTAKNILGPWQAKFSVPGSAALPQQTPVIQCTFSKPPEYRVGFLSATFTNLNDRPYVVMYAILGYDEKGRKISEGKDDFVIGKHESVVRKVFVESQAGTFHLDRIGSVFWIQMVLEE